MSVLEVVPWIGWLATVGGWMYHTWPTASSLPQPDPVTNGWHQILMSAQGEVESIRRVRDGSAPMRIERSHGTKRTWYRLTHVDELSLIYKPEPFTK